MDNKMMSLGRAKKKLRYLQPEDKALGTLKIRDGFSLKDLDNIFDDLDSESDSALPQLSPLPKSVETVVQGRGTPSQHLKPTSSFETEEPEVLAPEVFIQVDHLNGRESPFKEIAPIKTSSPINLGPAGDGAGDSERQETSPVLFGIEDEEPVGASVSKPRSLRSESPKRFLQEDSESLVSPPARLEFGKLTTQNVVSVKRCMPVECPDVPSQESQSSAPETREESRVDGSPSLLPAVLDQNSPLEPLLKEQPMSQAPEVKLDMELKESSFQQKLKNAFQPKTLWKQEARKPQARAVSPLELEDDFMILEDDAPLLFAIPRKAGSSQKQKHAPERVSFGPDNKSATQDESASTNLRDEPDAAKSKKAKAKRGKISSDKDTVTQAAPEERNDPLPEVDEVVGVYEPASVPEASQDADLPGKQRTNSKTSKKLVKNNGKNDNPAEIPTEKPASKRKKAVKLTSDANNMQEEHTSKVKKKASKAKSKVAVTEDSAEPDEQNNDDATLTNKQMPEEQEQVINPHNNTEPSQEPTEQSVPVKKTKRQPAAKPGISKNAKKAQKTKEDAKIKELLVSPEGPVNSKRKRKPPGEWWMASDVQCGGDTQAQAVVVQESLQELQSNKKMRRKEAPTVSSQSTEDQSEPVRPVTVQKVVRKVRKSTSKHDPKNPKTTAGKKTNSAAPKLRGAQSKTPTPSVGEEVAVGENVEQPSPEASSPLRWQSRTPVEKTAFDKIYTRDSQPRSAQKQPPSTLHQPETLAAKRQRKPTSNWWEVPQSQGSELCSSQKSNPQMPLVDKAATEVSSRKTAIGAQKKTKMNMVQTPKSIRRCLATFDAKPASGKPGSSTGQKSKQKGRRNLFHSLEDQSEQSSENIHGDPQHGSSHATFDVCTSGVIVDPFTDRGKAGARLSAASKRASGAFKSGPSSWIELERFEENEDSDLILTRTIPNMQHVPRVLSDCDLCGPPLRPIVLESEDWDNLCAWFAHLWPSSSKEGKMLSVISPDDFHWHSHGGRAMGHMVDLQNNTFSNGKILLGSYMKKPPQVDLHAVTVFNVVSSCVRVEIDGVKTVYSSGQAFMTPCGLSYSIHNVCREPAVLWYHRMLPNDTRN